MWDIVVDTMQPGWWSFALYSSAEVHASRTEIMVRMPAFQERDGGHT